MTVIQDCIQNHILLELQGSQKEELRIVMSETSPYPSCACPTLHWRPYNIALLGKTIKTSFDSFFYSGIEEDQILRVHHGGSEVHLAGCYSWDFGNLCSLDAREQDSRRDNYTCNLGPRETEAGSMRDGILTRKDEKGRRLSSWRRVKRMKNE